MNRIILKSSLVLILTGSLFVGMPVSSLIAQEEKPGNQEWLDRAKQATVFLSQVLDQDGYQVISCIGSGTIISPDGLILTNAHLGSPIGICEGERVIVSLSVRTEDPPVPTYLAEVIQSDVDSSLVILQIRGSLDGSIIDPNTLNLPYVEFGDPSMLVSGSPVSILGYPDIGATPATFEERMLTTAVSEKGHSRSSWFRLDSAVPGGMSGGGVYSEGRLLGVATSAPATPGSISGMNCLNIQDSNNDGKIDSADACAPIGDPVQIIRPINFAQAMVEAARNEFRYSTFTGIPQTINQDPPVISHLFFSSQITDEGLPADLITQAPSGITSLYLFFDFRNMVPGSAYQLRVTRDGIEASQLSLAAVPWGASRQGQWYIGTENVIWPDGNYEFSVLVNGNPLGSARLTIGSAGFDEQRLSNLVFSSVNASGSIGISGVVLPTLIQEIRAFFDFTGMVDQQSWTEVWYLDSTEISRITRLWDNGPSGRLSVSALNVAGLPMGTYRVDLFIGDRLALSGDVLLAGNPTPATYDPYVFNNPVIFSDISRDGIPTGYQGPILPLGVNKILMYFDYDYMPNGQFWTYRWYLDGKLVGGITQLWDAGGVGKNFWISLSSESPLPEGSYAVEVLAFGKPMISAVASVGSGTQPTSGSEAAATEVFINGRVLDALTGRGISGAQIIILDVRFESTQFLWDESQIWVKSITDREGRFSLQRGLPKGAYYTFYVFAEGYFTLLEDFFIITSDQVSPVDLEIHLNRP